MHNYTHRHTVTHTDTHTHNTHTHTTHNTHTHTLVRNYTHRHTVTYTHTDGQLHTDRHTVTHTHTHTHTHWCTSSDRKLFCHCSIYHRIYLTETHTNTQTNKDRQTDTDKLLTLGINSKSKTMVETTMRPKLKTAASAFLKLSSVMTPITIIVSTTEVIYIITEISLASFRALILTLRVLIAKITAAACNKNLRKNKNPIHI